ncbi:hypothetical protein M422DRAFT_259655 [Sphaerobolus stellatus SS14]|uniref:Uncharacterized protein n=1 Tax=Sphaerobolus stellatus (strain SS14) TaxID=990650 RepID=A0A0C9USK4_SPHS4|nr:hypothetical protein M422DRAFT_259655 [Sphaerobolus stellatus SS14]
MEEEEEEEEDELDSERKWTSSKLLSRRQKLKFIDTPIVPAMLNFAVYLNVKTVKMVNLPGSTEWVTFLNQMANILNLALKELELAYKFSNEKKDSPTRKEQETVTAATKKSKAKRVVTTLEILITQSSKKEFSRKKKGKETNAKWKRNIDNDSNDGSGKEEIPGTNWLLQLENKYACTVSKYQYCFIPPNGKHMRLLHADLGLWGNMIDSGHADKNMAVPPLHLVQSQTPQVAPQPQIVYLQAPPMEDPYRYDSYSHGRDAYALPSSEPEESEDPRLFPKVSIWLQELQQSILGEDGHDFVQYATVLKEAKYICISQLAEMKLPELRETCFDIPEGTAQIILTQASKRVGKICAWKAKERWERKWLFL